MKNKKRRSSKSLNKDMSAVSLFCKIIFLSAGIQTALAEKSACIPGGILCRKIFRYH